MKRAKSPSVKIRELGSRLVRSNPFPNGHNRNEARDYESYRQSALTFLTHQGLSYVRSVRIVDDVIAAAENLTGRATCSSLDA